MENANNAQQGQQVKVTFWGALGQIALAGIASYGMAKMTNNNVAWTPYRNEMLGNMATAAFGYLGQQMQATQQTVPANQAEPAADQQAAQ